jgi:hypothetical protein
MNTITPINTVRRTGLNCLAITHVNVRQTKHLRSHSNDRCKIGLIDARLLSVIRYLLMLSAQ